jgi:hypothetical protein
VPEKYAADAQDGCHFTGRVTRWDPPFVFAHTWPESEGGESEVIFALTPEGDRVRLRLTHRRLSNDRAQLTSVAAGWHTHLTILIAKLEGRAPPAFWATHTQVEAAYARALAR